MDSNLEERRCENCDEKITKVAQRVDLMENELHRIKENHGNIVGRFETHMEKEETAFKSFYAALGQLENRISTIVINGLKDISSLKEAVREEMGEVNKSFITQKEALVAVSTATIVAGSIAFVFINFETESVQDDVSKKLDILITEMRKG